MHSSNPFNCGTDILVNKSFGKSYKVVKGVYEHLDELLRIYSELDDLLKLPDDETLNFLEDNFQAIEDVLEIKDSIIEVRNNIQVIIDVYNQLGNVQNVIEYLPQIEEISGELTTVVENIDSVNKVALGLDAELDSAVDDYGSVTDPIKNPEAASGALINIANNIDALLRTEAQLPEILEVIPQANAVSYVEQNLTEAQQKQARKNIGALSEAALINKDGSTKVGYQVENGSLRTVANKLNEVISVKDYGAKGDGITDDTSAFTLAASSGKIIFIPTGSYYLTNNITTGTFIGNHDIIFIKGVVSYEPITKKEARFNLSFFIKTDGSDDVLTADWGTSPEKAFKTFNAAFKHFNKFYEITSTTGQVNFNFGAGDFGDINLIQNNPGCYIRLYGTDTIGSTRFHLINVDMPGTVYLGNLSFSCIELRQCTLWATGKMFVIKDDRHTKYAIASGVLTTDFILEGTATLSFAEPVTYSKAPFYVNCELRAGATITGQNNVTAPYKYYATDNEFVNCASSVYDQLTWANDYYVEPYANSLQLRLAKDLLKNKGFGGPVIKNSYNYAIFAFGIAMCWGSARISNSTSTVVDLPITMNSPTTYFVQVSSRSSTTAVLAPANSDKTTTSFTVRCANQSTVAFDWFLIGMCNGS